MTYFKAQEFLVHLNEPADNDYTYVDAKLFKTGLNMVKWAAVYRIHILPHCSANYISLLVFSNMHSCNAVISLRYVLLVLLCQVVYVLPNSVVSSVSYVFICLKKNPIPGNYIETNNLLIKMTKNMEFFKATFLSIQPVYFPLKQPIPPV